MKITATAATRVGKVTTIDQYLAAVGARQRAALGRLRAIVRSAAPRAEEYIAYGLPGFRLDGRPLVYFGASKSFCSFYPGSVLAKLGLDLDEYDTSKGTIRFTVERPLPAALVRRIVKARIAQIAAPQAGRKRRVAARRSR